MNKLFLGIITFLLIPAPSYGAVLYLLPQSATVWQGDTFIVEVRVNTEGENVGNLRDTEILFPSSIVEVVDTSEGGSIFSSKQSISRKGGAVFFAGEIAGGFQGDGLLGRIMFLAKETGTAQIAFHDTGDFAFLEGNYEIQELPRNLPQVSSLSNPDPTKWYGVSTLRIHWNLEEGSQYSFELSKDPLAEPDHTPDRPEGQLLWMGEMEYAGLGEGIYYFHLRECRVSKTTADCAWGPKSTFRIMMDATSPEEFQPEIREIDGMKQLVFETRDGLSGVDHYEVAQAAQKVFLGVVWGKRPIPEDWGTAQSPFALEDQTLQSALAVKAVDKAGNQRVAEIAPEVRYLEDVWPMALLILLVIGAVAGWVFSHKSIKS